MSRRGWRAAGFREAGIAALALLLLAGCNQGTAQDSAGVCTPPPPWREADAKPGQPAAELTACLKDQAYQTRDLKIPVESAAYGVVAQCEVRVDRFEGVTVPANDAAADREAVRQATAAVTQYRQCVGR